MNGTGCDGNGNACINSTQGVGRLATFDNWADYNAVSSQLGGTTDYAMLGMYCSTGGALSNYDPYGNCNPPVTIPGSPTCTQVNGYQVFLGNTNSWNNFTGYSNYQAYGYVCEAGNKN